MPICIFCKRVCGSNGALTVHARSCKDNPDRLPGYFAEKHHTPDTRRKQAKSFIGKVPSNILDVSSRTVSKILQRLGIGCSVCDWDKGRLDLHHIVPRRQGGTDDDSNLTLVCPNCHRLAHEGKITSFVSIKEQIGNMWRECYFSHK